MRSSSSKAASRAFTLLEMFVVVATIGMMVLILLPLATTRNKPIRINCMNNLKQTGLAFRMWEDDNGVFPMQYRSTNFDGPRYALEQKMYLYFQAMSNELNTPKIIVCPGDESRSCATNFTTDFNNARVSYFVGLDANITNAAMFLVGDRHVDNGLPVRNGILGLKTDQKVRWTKINHHGEGNIGLADGSVMEVTSSGLQHALLNTGTNLTRLALP